MTKYFLKKIKEEKEKSSFLYISYKLFILVTFCNKSLQILNNWSILVLLLMLRIVCEWVEIPFFLPRFQIPALKVLKAVVLKMQKQTKQEE